MKNYFTYLFLFVLIGLLFFLYGFSLKRNQHKKITDIKIEFEHGNNQFLTRLMVNKLLIQNNRSIKNISKGILDLHKLKKHILANPYIEKAIVFLTINGSLVTRIKQREPIARIQNKYSSFYIDKQGVEIPLSKKYSARVLLVMGVKINRDIQKVTQLVTKILSDDFLKKEIVGIQKLVNGDYVFNVRTGNYKIDFGNIKNIDTKFEKIKAFYNKTFANKQIQKYKIINVKYHNQVVCTK